MLYLPVFPVSAFFGWLFCLGIRFFKDPALAERHAQATEERLGHTPEWARGLTGIMWIGGLGGLLLMISAWPMAIQAAFSGQSNLSGITKYTDPLAFIGILLILAGLLVAWTMRPRWALPSALRTGNSPLEARRSKLRNSR